MLRNTLGIKQGEFARKISTTQGHISDIENGRKDLSDRTIKLICLEFNVNENWLRHGTGEMFEESKDDDIAMSIGRILASENDFTKSVFLALSKLDSSEWKVIEKLIEEISKNKNE
jgi:transcriptional regulator with XRE-family HTH domain